MWKRAALLLVLAVLVACDKPPAPNAAAGASSVPAANVQPPAPRGSESSADGGEVRYKGMSLQGQWQLRIPRYPACDGMVLIDAENRVTFDGPTVCGNSSKSRAGGSFAFRGYVAEVDREDRILIPLTNGTQVARMICAIQSRELLYCRHLRSDGTRSAAFYLTLVGRGPTKLLRS